jgi:hypothetical protein
MQQAVVLIGERDGALRELMGRALEGVDYAILESESAAQLAVVLRTRRFTSAPQALLIASTAMLEACSGTVGALARWRAALGRPVPHVLLTCELGMLKDSSLPDLGACISAGILEKPFELALLRGVAHRCRTFTTSAPPFTVTKW